MQYPKTFVPPHKQNSYTILPTPTMQHDYKYYFLNIGEIYKNKLKDMKTAE